MTRPAPAPDTTADAPAVEATPAGFSPQRIRINAAALIPSLVIVVAVAALFAGQPPLLQVALGAAGWLIALVLRQPVALIAMKVKGQETANTIVGWSSGPAEETVRLVMVLLVVAAWPEAVWFGVGWAGIEILFAMVNSLALASIVGKDDEKSRQALEVLSAMGTTAPPHPAWGFLERLSASAMHIGFTLLVFVQPWLVLVTLPLHSLINMMTVRFVKRSVAAVEVGLAIAGVVILAAGILALQL